MAEFEAELPSSDESDEDFVPSGEDNLPSEEESNSEYEEEQPEEGSNKRSKHNKKSKKRKRVESNSESNDKGVGTKEEEKPKLSTDELWKEFTSGPKESKSEKAGEMSTSTPEVKTVTQVCTFAGEQVKVEKQIPVSSRGRGRGRGGGLSGILGTLGKQPKLSVLEKSKLDWNQFKQAEGLEEHLSTFNKGKDGYLEKQDFLQRTDLRQFEQEKELRNATRKTLR